MKIVAQRVSSSRVSVDGQTVGEIGAGLCVLVGVGEGDTKADAEKLADKLASLRIFSDARGKMNLSVTDIGGSVLAISQFTLYADCKKGRRPSFVRAAAPEIGNELYEVFMDRLRSQGLPVEMGIFGADMKVEIANEGPVTIILDSTEI